MRKILLALSAISIVIAASSMAFAYDEDEARNALIAYSGTEAFGRLYPEEKRACMSWVSEGGYMDDTCSSAVTRLITEDPDAVTQSQRRALLAAASGRTSSESAQPAPQPIREKEVVIEKSDNTGTVIAAGVAGVIAGMVIHNNLPREKEKTVYYPVPEKPQRHRPEPHRRSEPPRDKPKPVKHAPRHRPH